MRHPTRELDDLKRTRHLTSRVGENFAVLGGHDRGNLVDPCMQQLTHREHHGRALGQRRRSPTPRRIDGCRDGLIDNIGRREVDLAGQLPGRGVEHVTVALGVAGVGLAANPVRDPAQVAHVVLPPSMAANASASTAMPSAASASVKVRGGAIRSTLPFIPPLPTNKPAALVNSIMRAAAAASGVFEPGTTSSTPIIKPLPRTSPMNECWCWRPRMLSISMVPSLAALA